ncbi:hypothetical protein XaC1_529 [Xanthomonas phage XaC1]|nr:hypothetical protein XaC1_529 [Xanthomonas phage XaC1]
MSLTLTLNKKQIKELAALVGFHVQDVTFADESTQVVITHGNIEADDNNPEFNGMLVYKVPASDNGTHPLG